MATAPLTRRLGYALAGVALGALGVGWHGQPTDDVIVAAIRARDPAYAGAVITLIDIDRDWPHEIFGRSTSRFLVSALVGQDGGTAIERCFGVEPGLAGIALALGPYADWRCDYPF